MKKLVLALMLGCFSLPIFAQDGIHRKADISPEDRAAKMVRKMAEQLNLNDDQIKDLQPVLLKFHQAEAEAQEERKERRNALKADMEKILTEEQMAKMDEMMEKHKAKLRKRRHHHEEQLEE